MSAYVDYLQPDAAIALTILKDLPAHTAITYCPFPFQILKALKNTLTLGHPHFLRYRYQIYKMKDKWIH
jgi:hypothetical protein